MCERPITYESSQWDAHSRCSWAHADSLLFLTHVKATHPLVSLSSIDVVHIAVGVR